jgi:hypothetical protein
VFDNVFDGVKGKKEDSSKPPPCTPIFWKRKNNKTPPKPYQK